MATRWDTLRIYYCAKPPCSASLYEVPYVGCEDEANPIILTPKVVVIPPHKQTRHMHYKHCGWDSGKCVSLIPKVRIYMGQSKV